MINFIKACWLKRKTVWRIWKSYDGLRGKIWAIRLIIYHAEAFLQWHFGFGLLFLRRFGVSGVVPGLQDPVGIRVVAAIEERLSPINVAIDKNREKTINFLLPNLEPKFFFAGYLSVFNMMKKLLERGHKLRIIITEPPPYDLRDILAQISMNSVPYLCLSRAEVILLHDRRNTEVPVSPEDIYFAYSWMTARLAHDAAQKTNGRPFIFYIQEYEAVFHPLDSIHALCNATYSLPHYAVFNSHLLPKYFQQRGIGVFENGVAYGEEHSVYFLHAISDVEAPTIGEISGRKNKKFLFYARPEAHAARNLFELGILALKEAIAQDVFHDDWEFHGIGALETECSVPLAEGKEMLLMKRKSLDEYVKLLKEYDVGMSLMYAPHPSVPPLEMAAAGMVTVTSLFENRTDSDMQKISRNIIAVQPSTKEICHGLAKAAKQAGNYEERIKNSRLDWPRRWEESFNDDFMMKLEKFIL